MIRDPSDGSSQTLTITMSGTPNDIEHFMWVLVHAGWDEKRSSARVYSNKMYIFPKDKPAQRSSKKILDKPTQPTRREHQRSG